MIYILFYGLNDNFVYFTRKIMKKAILKNKILFFLNCIVLLTNLGIICDLSDKFVQINHKTIFTDLELDKVFAEWNRTKTVSGPFFLQSILLNPLKDEYILSDRQNFIKKLTTEQTVFKKIQKALEDIAESEFHILTYFKIENNDFLKSLDSLLNSTAGVQGIANYNSATQQGWFVFKLMTSFFHIFNAVGGREFGIEIINKIFDFNGYTINTSNFTYGAIAEIFKQHSPWRKIGSSGTLIERKDAITAFYKGYVRDLFDYLRQGNPPIYTEGNSKVFHFFKDIMHKINHSYITAPVAFLAAITPTILYDLNLYHSLIASKGTLNSFIVVISAMQNHCCMVKKYINALKTIVEIQKQYPCFSKILPDISDVLNNKKFKELVSILNTSTFEYSKKFFFYHGRVMHVHKLLRTHSALFKPLSQYIGELDAYMSIAQIVNETKDSSHSFTFAEYVNNNEGAIIDAKKTWHPLLFKKSVKQDVHLGVQSNTPHAVITGPNWSGKSIYLKTVALVVYFAQTFTIVPADFCALTLFNQIRE